MSKFDFADQEFLENEEKKGGAVGRISDFVKRHKVGTLGVAAAGLLCGSVAFSDIDRPVRNFVNNTVNQVKKAPADLMETSQNFIYDTFGLRPSPTTLNDKVSETKEKIVSDLEENDSESNYNQQGSFDYGPQLVESAAKEALEDFKEEYDDERPHELKDIHIKQAAKGLSKWPDEFDVSWLLIGGQMFREGGWWNMYDKQNNLLSAEEDENPYRGFLEVYEGVGIKQYKKATGREWFDDYEGRLEGETLEDFKQVCGYSLQEAKDNLNNDQRCNVALSSSFINDLQMNFYAHTRLEGRSKIGQILDQGVVYEFAEDGDIKLQVDWDKLEERKGDYEEIYHKILDRPNIEEHQFTVEEIKEDVPDSELSKSYYLGPGNYADKLSNKNPFSDIVYHHKVLTNAINLQEYTQAEREGRDLEMEDMPFSW